MALPNPVALTSATRFRPAHFRAHSRSPSRSPVRKAQFTAQHLDPLLSNLSPNSTLKALQATETIPEGSTQDALTNSIADASQEEREIGIRAAFTAQKLREWRNEIAAWTWPGRRERGLGAGFLPPSHQDSGLDGEQRLYLGCLPIGVVDRYEERIEEIKDALESLEMENIKDHVLEAHIPLSGTAPHSQLATQTKGSRASYGRMRDFTALITATVIQALPDLAIVNMLIDTWDVRLAVLKEIPTLLEALESTKAGVGTAMSAVRQPEKGHELTLDGFKTLRELLGMRVSDACARMDKLLDLLDGHEDSLPQAWVDQLENVELDYATWTKEAEHIATTKQASNNQSNNERQAGTGLQHINNAANGSALSPKSSTESLQPKPGSGPVATALSPAEVDELGSGDRSKPGLTLELPSQLKHKREKSEVSVADSTYSALSDVSNAEIVDARQTQVLASPRVSVVDNPFPDSSRPPMLQRASTTSIEVVPKDQVKKIDMRRSMSADLLVKMSQSQSPESTPTRAFKQLTGDSPTKEDVADLEASTPTQLARENKHQWPEPSSSLMVEPLKVRSRDVLDAQQAMPAVPRRSSKRASSVPMISRPQEAPIETVEDGHLPENPPSDTVESQRQALRSSPTHQKPSDSESLDSKIQGILMTLPTKIRLATEDSSSQPKEDPSGSSSRALTPTPTLTLAPAKTRKTSVSDPDIRVYHLVPNGQSRDTTPIKLFVRAVGENGERVMVRVGGGWADLGEYLKEYSAHHGRRSVTEGKLEVAQYPASASRSTPGSASHIPAPINAARGNIEALKRRRRRASSASEGSSPRHSRSRSPSPPSRDEDDPANSPPPVPPIPAGYTMKSPTMRTTLGPNGETHTTLIDEDADGIDVNDHSVRSNAMTVPGVNTKTTIAPSAPSTNSKYVPLGAAGPKPAGTRRAATYGAGSDPANDAWVEGMVGKARAVSGSNVVQGPTTTTTTTVTTSSTPSSRRASTMGLTALPSPKSPTGPNKLHKRNDSVTRRKSRLSLGDVSGIKRVFLRKK